MTASDLTTVQRLEGPRARVTLAVLQQALLSPIGADRLIVAVRHRGGRLTVVTTDAANGSNPAPGFLWADAAPFIGALRSATAGTAGSVVEVQGALLYVYAADVDDSSDVAVLGVRFPDLTADARAAHAPVSSTLYSLLAQSDRAIPDASVSVELSPEVEPVEAVVRYVGDGPLRQGTAAGPTSVAAVADAMAAAIAGDLSVRYADHVAVDGEPVSLVVVDSTLGPIVGAAGGAAPRSVETHTMAPALAVLKAHHAIGRLRAETATTSPVTAVAL